MLRLQAKAMLRLILLIRDLKCFTVLQAAHSHGVKILLRLQAKAKLRVSPTKTLALMKPLLMLDCILRLQAKAMLRLILLNSVMTCSTVLHGLTGVEDEVQGAVRLYK